MKQVRAELPRINVRSPSDKDIALVATLLERESTAIAEVMRVDPLAASQILKIASTSRAIETYHELSQGSLYSTLPTAVAMQLANLRNEMIQHFRTYLRDHPY